eukprot:3152148-Pyramimonas_sp.AAC.1
MHVRGYHVTPRARGGACFVPLPRVLVWEPDAFEGLPQIPLQRCWHNFRQVLVSDTGSLLIANGIGMPVPTEARRQKKERQYCCRASHRKLGNEWRAGRH